MSKQSIFIFILILVLGVTGYLWYGYFQASPPEGSTNQQNQDEIARLARVSTLGGVDLDTSLFQDPLFNSLTLPQIIPQPDVPPGRVNPFIPF